MNKILKKTLLLVFFSLISSSFLYAFADEPQQNFQGFNLQGYKDSGEKAWDVKGDTADVKGTSIAISNVDANSYGEQKMNLTAKTGTMDQTSGKMHLEKDVVITSAQGMQLKTESLDWDRKKDLVSTKEDVLITDKGLEMSGKGMDAKPELKNAKIQEDVTVKVNTEPKKTDGKVVTITSDGPMTIDQVKGQAVFLDNVVAVQENQTLKTDRLEVYFNIDQSQIKQMVCIGNVIIEQGENRTFAEKAVYDAESKKLTLSGRPKLIMLTEGENAFALTGN